MMNQVKFERYSVTVNVGLAGNPLASDHADDRARAYAKQIRHLLARYNMPVQPNTSLLMAAGQSETEATDIIRFDVLNFDVSSRWAVKDTLADLQAAMAVFSAGLDQEAVAYVVYDTAVAGQPLTQRLAGPDAAKWGEFDPAHFIPYSSIAAVAAARFIDPCGADNRAA
jgi:hypothetical protein